MKKTWDTANPRLHDIEIRVSSSPAIQTLGADLAMQIGNGSSGGPTFYSVDLVGLNKVLKGATPAPSPAWGLGTQKLYAGASFDSGKGPAEANGLLALVQLDSRYITGDQTWPLTFVNNYGGGTHLWDDSGNDVPLGFTAGSIRVNPVPEPTVYIALASLGVVGLPLLAWQRYRARRASGHRRSHRGRRRHRPAHHRSW